MYKCCLSAANQANQADDGVHHEQQPAGVEAALLAST